ncbi:lactonase family protein [Roseivirga pacifica]|jgi:6-phosphogluconolactonase|uniref:lactonase family protein n=1 Tax=Roseivirga pacifica TaxID=1267423 RepID=UPI003BAD4796
MKRFFGLIALVALFFSCEPKQTEQKVEKESDTEILFVGTYTKKEGHVDGKGKGVYVYEMNKKTGALSFLSVSDSIVSPSYVAVHPSGEYVYAANEYHGGDDAFATLSALKYNAEDHSITLINQVSSMGQYPCHISIDNTGKFVMAANYDGGSVVLYPIQEDGALGELASYKKHEGGSSHPRQDAPHAHQIIQHPRLGFVTAVDLGADKIYEYSLDTLSQTLDYVTDYPNSPDMSGPRHMAFHPTLNISYTLNELIGTIEVTELRDSDRFMGNMQVISTQEDGDEREPGSGAIKVHPNGKFLYATNRFDINEVVVFSIGEKGELTRVGHQSTLGKTPRDIAIDPSGKFLLAANQDSGTIVTFAIDQETGLLTETGYVEEVPSAVCIQFLK